MLTRRGECRANPRFEPADVRQQDACRQVPHLHRVDPARRVQVLSAEVRRHPVTIEGRRHGDQAVGRLGPVKMFSEERQQEVGLQATLVELVDNDGVKSDRLVESPQDDARRREKDLCRGAGAAFVTDVVTHTATELLALQLGQALREAAAGDATRLHHQHATRAPGRHPGRLAGAGGRGHDDRTGGEGVGKPGVQGVDRQGFARRLDGHPTKSNGPRSSPLADRRERFASRSSPEYKPGSRNLSRSDSLVRAGPRNLSRSDSLVRAGPSTGWTRPSACRCCPPR